MDAVREKVWPGVDFATANGGKFAPTKAELFVYAGRNLGDGDAIRHQFIPLEEAFLANPPGARNYTEDKGKKNWSKHLILGAVYAMATEGNTAWLSGTVGLQWLGTYQSPDIASKVSAVSDVDWVALREVFGERDARVAATTKWAAMERSVRVHLDQKREVAKAEKETDLYEILRPLREGYREMPIRRRAAYLAACISAITGF